jgi:hypothetical protein
VWFGLVIQASFMPSKDAWITKPGYDARPVLWRSVRTQDWAVCRGTP